MSEAAATKPEITRDISYPPVFATTAEERKERKRKLTAALRVFGKFGFDEGVAGHFTVRDPELTDHFWVNPFGRSFKQMRVSDLILVNHSGDIVEGFCDSLPDSQESATRHSGRAHPFTVWQGVGISGAFTRSANPGLLRLL